EQLGARGLLSVVRGGDQPQRVAVPFEVHRVTGDGVTGGGEARHRYLVHDLVGTQVEQRQAAQLELAPVRGRVFGDPGAQLLAVVDGRAVLVVDEVAVVGGNLAPMLLPVPLDQAPRSPGHAVHGAALPVDDDAADVVAVAELLGDLERVRVDPVHDRVAIRPVFGNLHPQVKVGVVDAAGAVGCAVGACAAPAY